MERFNDKMLTNAALLFILVILLTMLWQWGASPAYKASTETVQEAMMAEDILILPYQLKDMTTDGSIADYTLVYLGEQKSIPNLIPNQMFVPLSELMENKSLKALKKHKQLILVADEESQAWVAANLLKSKGLNNVFVASRSLDFMLEQTLADLDLKVAESQDEKAHFDYNRFFRTDAVGVKKAASKAALPEGQVEIKAVGGGC